MKSYCTLCYQIFYYFFTRLFKFFFPLSFILPDIFSHFNFFFLYSPSLLRSLPLFSVLSLFSIARKKEIAWVEHSVAWGWRRGADLGLGVLGVAWVWFCKFGFADTGLVVEPWVCVDLGVVRGGWWVWDGFDGFWLEMCLMGLIL